MATGPFHFFPNRAEAARLELASGELPPPGFETGSSSSRLTSVRRLSLCESAFFRGAKGDFLSGCGGRNRTCEGAINSRPTVPARKHHKNQSARLGSNQHFRAPKARGIPIVSHTPKERPAGVEPALPPWRGSRLPLHHGRNSITTKLSNSEWDPRDSNPHLPG